MCWGRRGTNRPTSFSSSPRLTWTWKTYSVCNSSKSLAPRYQTFLLKCLSRWQLQHTATAILWLRALTVRALSLRMLLRQRLKRIMSLERRSSSRLWSTRLRSASRHQTLCLGCSSMAIRSRCWRLICAWTISTIRPTTTFRGCLKDRQASLTYYPRTRPSHRLLAATPTVIIARVVWLLRTTFLIISSPRIARRI